MIKIYDELIAKTSSTSDFEDSEEVEDDKEVIQ